MAFNIPKSDKPRVVIVGGGFGGLKLANRLKGSGFQVVLVDRNNYHQFPPLIYQVASAGIEPSSIAFPFRKIFQRREDFYFRLAEVRSVFPEQKILQTSIGKVHYDYLVFAAGTTTNFFGNKNVAENAIPMKNVSEAMGLRNALLENVAVSADGKIDFADNSATENTRVSYPITHIKSIVRPISAAPAAKNVIFLSADAFGVLPPVSILNAGQTQYYFLSGFTAKLAGTERGITEPTPTFSACFGQAFLELHPTKYAEELVKKMEKSGAKAYLVNTGWNGTGKRISIKDTRGIIDGILSGAILSAPTKQLPIFNFEIPTELTGVATEILDPRDTYASAAEWETKAKDLAGRFVKNFEKYTTNEAGKALVAAGPQL